MQLSIPFLAVGKCRPITDPTCLDKFHGPNDSAFTHSGPPRAVFYGLGKGQRFVVVGGGGRWKGSSGLVNSEGGTWS